MALALPAEYYESLAREYRLRRDRLLASLRAAGLRAFTPRGAYYIMTDVAPFGFADDVAFVKFLVEEIGVAAVPGSSFYKSAAGKQQVRFAFCKRDATLDAAGERLQKLAARAHVAK